jgi:anaerobic selenocysteine-containing dehydrogenase
MYRTAVCPHDCPSVCALEVEVQRDGTLGRVRGNRRQRYTDGVICAKVARYAERLHHPERLTRPLARTGAKGEGRFAPITWDDALDRIAEAFLDAERRHGPEAVWPYYYAGTMGLVQRDGINRLRHVKRYSGQDDTICTRIATTGWNAGAGARWGVDATEIPRSEVIVLWGLNAVATQVQLMNFIARARRNGATLVVVDPYRSPTAKQADVHLPLRPGSDAALACAVMHVLFEEGMADRDYLERYTDDPRGLEAHLATRTPAWASPITGLDAEAIRGFARLYGGTKRSYLRLGFGFTRSRNGAVNMHAASCLPAVTGAWRVEGGGALYNQGDLYPLDMTRIMGLDARNPAVRLLDMSAIGRVLTGDAEALVGGPPVTAMLIQNVNPACVAPELDRVHAGLRRDDLFVAVHEQFLTDTAKFADLVLPATMFLEHDDIYRASGHTILQISPKRVEPPGECR